MKKNIANKAKAMRKAPPKQLATPLRKEIARGAPLRARSAMARMAAVTEPSSSERGRRGAGGSSRGARGGHEVFASIRTLAS